PPVPGRRRRAAEAEQRPRALGGEAERPRTLDLRLPRAGGLEQDLTQQLVGWLDDCGRPELERHRVLERRRLPQQRDRVVPGPIRLPQQRPQLLFEDARHAVFLRAGVDRGTHLTEGHEVRQVALGGRAVAPRRELVLRHYLIPHPQREEDVGGHVLRVRGVGRDVGIRPGRGQTERRPDRVVVAMDQEVRRARVVRVVPEYLFGDGGG